MVRKNEQHRSGVDPKLRERMISLAYRMLGSISEAEDAVQAACLRWLQQNTSEIRSPEAWFVSVTTRICIDRLRQISVERRHYNGTWLPEPIVDPVLQPDRAMELASDISMAFLIVLERLSPDERAIFILHDVFGNSFAHVSSIVGKSEAACRQIASRARARVRDRPRFQVGDQAHRKVVEQFLYAMETGNEQALVALLADKAVLSSDGGGKVKVSRSGIRGGCNIARLVARGRLIPRGLRPAVDRITRQLVLINDEPGIATYLDENPMSTISIQSDGIKVHAIFQILNPDKLINVAPLTVLGQCK